MLLRVLIVAMLLAAGRAYAQQSLEKAPAADPRVMNEIRQAMEANRYREAMQQQAERSYNLTQTREYQAGIEQLKTKIFPNYQAQDQNNGVELDNGDRLYLFVSSSMPLEVVRRYARQIEGLPGATLVLRGFIGGASRVKPTLRYKNKVLADEESCTEATCKTINTAMAVDPVLFQRYQIKRVPAVVTVGGLTGAGQCSEGNKDVVKIRQKNASFGDAPLLAHLEKMAESGDQVAARYRDKVKKHENR